MFEPVSNSVKFPELEKRILTLWKERRIYEKSLERRRGAPRYVFYEGPPTANGLPHPGHCLTRAIKDLFPRYRTMRGYLCERKAGWDTHGLPVEVEVCKELGIHSKEEIEAYGIEKFIQKCQQSVWRYMREWERITERIGFWVDIKNAYATYHQSYVESVWWSLKNLFDRGLLYQGHKIVWWWAQGGTALSAGEVGLGYREVADPSVYVKFPLLDDAGRVTDTALVIWTTTPWTLPSNQYVAVHPNLLYVTLQDAQDGSKIIVSASSADALNAKTKNEFAQVGDPIRGIELFGRRYLPPFAYYFDRFASEMSVIHLVKDATYSPVRNYGRRLFAEFAGDSSIANMSADQVEKGTNEWIAKCNPRPHGWTVVTEKSVTDDTGTGLVHLAPAFGELDFNIFIEQANLVASGGGSLSLLCPVSPDGTFTDEAPVYCRGRWVKDCDKEIIRDLKMRGKLVHQEQYVHDYPFCWRAEEDPLIQYPRQSWFIRTTAFKDKMLENNAKINWLPDHIKTGRFGKFLESNVDWALSRERYWGTPLPIWKCQETGKMEAIGSYDELLAKPGVRGNEYWEQAKTARPELPDDLQVHKPYIDEITYDSPFAKGARMRRVTEVIDCWYDSGAMPFAQWGFRGVDGPIDAIQRLNSQFPADFISEAIDQTRGWFYSLLAISTIVGKESRVMSNSQLTTSYFPFPHPFKTCIVLGHMLGEDGQKMSKSKRNYREPTEIFDKYGADALRWYFFANQPPWTSIRYNEQAIKDSIPEFLLRLWNVYVFFVIYARIDGFDPAEELSGQVQQLGANELSQAKSFRPSRERSELDRWILSELHRTTATIVERMDAYDNYGACGAITEFVDALSNWYVRRSRDRFWSEDKRDRDKLDAYWTLYECLLTTSKIIAPFVPFLAEAFWQNLAIAEFGGKVLESVHLCDFPAGDPAAVDRDLSARMALVREIVSQGRSARVGAKMKVRQPLAKVEVILADRTHQSWLEEHSALIAEELNVKQVEFTQRADQYITYTVLPDLKRLGPRIGKRLPALKQAISSADAAVLLANLETDGSVTLTIDGEPIVLDSQDLQVRLQAKPGWAAAQGKSCVVVLSTELNDDLIAEGWAREIVHIVQTARKDINCQYTDRIAVGVETDDAIIGSAVKQFADYIRGETLASELKLAPVEGVTPTETKVGTSLLRTYVKVVKS